MEFKGTTGDWQQANGNKGFIVNSQDPIQQILICKVYGNDEESEANALLISNAKKMLEKLKSVLNLNNSAKEYISEDFFTEIEALIKSATELPQ